MIRTELRLARARLSGLVAVFVILTAGSAVLMVCASIAQAGARDRITPIRLADADAVVVASPDYPAAGEPYPEKVRLPIRDVQLAATTAGVIRAVGDVSVALLRSLIGRHAWVAWDRRLAVRGRV
jgi:hypothetical protein